MSFSTRALELEGRELAVCIFEFDRHGEVDIPGPSYSTSLVNNHSERNIGAHSLNRVLRFSNPLRKKRCEIPSSSIKVQGTSGVSRNTQRFEFWVILPIRGIGQSQTNLFVPRGVSPVIDSKSNDWVIRLMDARKEKTLCHLGGINYNLHCGSRDRQLLIPISKQGIQDSTELGVWNNFIPSTGASDNRRLPSERVVKRFHSPIRFFCEFSLHGLPPQTICLGFQGIRLSHLSRMILRLFHRNRHDIDSGRLSLRSRSRGSLA